MKELVFTLKSSAEEAAADADEDDGQETKVSAEEAEADADEGEEGQRALEADAPKPTAQTAKGSAEEAEADADEDEEESEDETKQLYSAPWEPTEFANW